MRLPSATIRTLLCVGADIVRPPLPGTRQKMADAEKKRRARRRYGGRTKKRRARQRYGGRTMCAPTEGCRLFEKTVDKRLPIWYDIWAKGSRNGTAVLTPSRGRRGLHGELSALGRRLVVDVGAFALTF